MKKLLSVLLTLSMIISLMPMNIMAADEPAFSDITGDEYYAESAQTLSEMGILEGYEDGTYGAERTITRAEMTAIICRLLGKEADAENAKGKTQYVDVLEDHWASGYINIATLEGIINGYGDGIFKPEDDVKYEESIKMLVCALGLAEDLVVDEKDWSKAYLDVADKKGITANLKGSKGQPATRGDIAVMSHSGVKLQAAEDSSKPVNPDAPAAPVASVAEGTYKTNQKVKLSTTTEGADIYYTTDGTTPTVKSTKYTKEITISKTTTLKAVATKDGVLLSDVMTVKYTIEKTYGGGGGGGGGGGYNPGTPVTFTVDSTLSANKYLYETSDVPVDAYIYLDITNTNSAITKVTLFEKNTNTQVVELKDDGNFATSGDDFSNDNKYSGKINLDISVDKEITYYAQIASSIGTVKSDEITIDIKTPINAEDIANMQTVDTQLETLVTNASFADKSGEEKKEAVEELLTTLSEQNLVSEETIVYDEATDVVGFEYTNGSLGGIMLSDFNEETATDDEIINSPRTRIEYGEVQNSTLKSSIPVQLTNSLSSNDIGTALILNGFENIPFRREFYENLETEWDDKGLATDLDTEITVDDLKNIGAYDIVVFATHGSTFKNSPVICLNEEANSYKDSLYAMDLTSKNIVRVTLVTGEKCYWVLPEFFTNNFVNSTLDIDLLFSECCNFVGENSVVSSAFSNALISKGVHTVIGYHNSVLAIYSRNMMKSVVDGIIDGQTAEASFEAAKSLWGMSDGHGAQPYYFGSSSTLLGLSLENGDFELSTHPIKWNTIGDVRTLTRLGDITPKSNNRMAIISTGIGSGESDHAQATEGSTMYQRFKIPEGSNVLLLDYNVISEEPHEYINTHFDDKFYVELVVDDETTRIAEESVNASTWKPVQNIDFADGDETAYETGWKKVQYDVSALNGKFVTLKFVTFDEGDSIYDTAALIDNVRLSETVDTTIIAEAPRHAPNMYVDWKTGNNTYDEITVDWLCEKDALNTHWGVHHWDNGYAAFQNIDGEHVLRLVLWDMPDGTTPTVEFALNGESGEFGSGKTGKQVFTNYDWSVDTWYSMRIEITSDENKSYYTQYVKTINESEWTKTACISYPLSDRVFTGSAVCQEDIAFNNLKRGCRVASAAGKIHGTENWENWYDCTVSNSYFPTEDATLENGGQNNVKFDCISYNTYGYILIQSGGDGYAIIDQTMPANYTLIPDYFDGEYDDDYYPDYPVGGGGGGSAVNPNKPSISNEPQL